MEPATELFSTKPRRINRLLTLLSALQSAQCCNTHYLSKLLGVSKRTVYRDLTIIRKAGVPCHYKSRVDGYAIDPRFHLLAQTLTTHEALSLLLFAHKMRNHIHIPFADSALRAALKIQANLSDSVKKYCNAALQKISIKAAPQVSMDLLDNIFAQFLNAILTNRIVEIHYRSDSGKGCTVTHLEPYYLLYADHTWYVIGKSSFHKKLYCFKLKRIKELNVLHKHFIEDDQFDINEYLSCAWSMKPENKLYHVRLRFAPDVAEDVAEVQWHRTQTVIYNDDGSATIEFCVDGLSEITWWILSFGDNVQVLAPKILRRKIAEIAQNITRNNQQD
jgi:predicted DNA-binding transcriptional regulator YafY